MMPASIALLAYSMSAITVLAAIVGVVVGWSSAKILRTGLGALPLDGIASCLSFWVVFWSALAVPWHGTYISGGWTFHDQFPHPMAWAFGAAGLASAFTESYRWWRARS